MASDSCQTEYSHCREFDVVVVGGGVAGLSAAIFTARHDLQTLVIDAGDSILRRNAHIENYPGFPNGVNPRLLLEMMRDQAENAGCHHRTGTVTQIDKSTNSFQITTEDTGSYCSDYVIAATKNTTEYLAELEGVGIIDRGKRFIDTDDRGRTGVDGLYAAGRLAEKPHQAVVNAGHGAEVAVTILEDDERPFYHDWVAPEGYFTNRGRELPPGCEEIGSETRRQREDQSRQTLQNYMENPHPEEQRTHPSLREE